MQADVVLIQAERRLIERADKLIVLADSSKFLVSASFSLCELREVDVLVTDNGIRREDLATLREHGVEVIVTD